MEAALRVRKIGKNRGLRLQTLCLSINLKKLKNDSTFSFECNMPSMTNPTFLIDYGQAEWK